MDVLLLAVNVVLGLCDVFLFFFFQSPMRSFFNMKDVGIVQVKILRAEGLMAADVTGKIMSLHVFICAYLTITRVRSN